LLSRDPAWMLSHWIGIGCPHTLSSVKGVSSALIKISSLFKQRKCVGKLK
jgi:hypothetical protein